jgi:hypothetical protein
MHKDLLQNTLNFQHCQRNFDLTKTLDNDIAQHLHQIALSTPSKQNYVNFDCIAITNRQLIRQIAEVCIHEDRDNLLPNLKEKFKNGRLQNPQVDAHMILLYFPIYEHENIDHSSRTGYKKVANWKELTNMEIGISTGAVGLAANMLGLRTGFCKCFIEDDLPEFTQYGIDKEDLEVILGIGYPLHKDHTVHTDDRFNSSSYKKQEQKKIFIK